MSSSLSKKILSAARQQQQELEGQDQQQQRVLRAQKWLEDVNPDGLQSDEEVS